MSRKQFRELLTFSVQRKKAMRMNDSSYSRQNDRITLLWLITPVAQIHQRCLWQNVSNSGLSLFLCSYIFSFVSWTGCEIVMQKFLDGHKLQTVYKMNWGEKRNKQICRYIWLVNLFPSTTAALITANTVTFSFYWGIKENNEGFNISLFLLENCLWDYFLFLFLSLT